MVIAVSSRVTVDNDATISARFLALIDDAFVGAAIDPDKRYITQGSWHHGINSGTTHDGAGTADLSTRELTRAEVERLVVELRRRGAIAWFRDATHGGFAEHIHAVLRDEAGLSTGAQWQVAEYDAGRDGLSSRGPDYHPRPAWKPFRVSRWTRVTRFPRTGVYALKTEHSARVAWKAFRPFPLKANVEYVKVERDSTGRPWLKTPAGNWILAKATAFRP